MDSRGECFWLHKLDKHKHKIGLREQRVPPYYLQVLTDDVRFTLEFYRLDKALRIGKFGFFRTHGLPMGGPLSPPLTTVDLETSFASVFTKQTPCPRHWLVKNQKLPHTIQGISYVDDMVIMSRSLCSSCLYQGVQDILPPDVETTLEENSQSGTTSFDFLHVHLEIATVASNKTPTLRFAPAFKNRDFALGLVQFPSVGKIPLFLPHASQGFETIKPYLWSRLFCAIQVWDGCIAEHSSWHMSTTGFVGLLVLECLRMLWPPQLVGMVFRGFPRHNRTLLARFIRLLGKHLVGWKFRDGHDSRHDSSHRFLVDEVRLLCDTARSLLD
jgi:hypothetical protein